jgi:beta-1,4-mannosyl-glycoprotein beta-1,4-N-acetylglucosaminyltransferase
LLEIRLNILSSVVDKFVLVESDRTFSNKNKPLFFEENKILYSDFIDKIIHIKITDYTSLQFNSAWDMEYNQRDKISEGLGNCSDDDVILISDLDEIPNPDEIEKYTHGVYGKDLFKLQQTFFYYFINYQKAVAKYWHGSRIITYSSYHDGNYMPQKIRNTNNVKTITNGGWHFSYLGGYEAIKYKIQSFAHQEYNNENYLNEKIIEKIKNGYDLFDRKGYRFIPVKIQSPDFPKYIINNQTKYAHLIYQEINYVHNFRVNFEIVIYLGLFKPIEIIKRSIKKIMRVKIYENIKRKIKKNARVHAGG